MRNAVEVNIEQNPEIKSKDWIILKWKVAKS